VGSTPRKNSHLARQVRRYFPSLAFLLAVLITWVLADTYLRPIPLPSVEIDDLNGLQKESTTIIVEMDKLIISLSLLVIGAIGGFILHKYENVKIRSLLQRVTIGLSFMLACSAVYFGYVLYAKIIEMLSNKMFDATLPLIQMPLEFQYYSFLFSLILFTVFVLNEIAPNMTESE